MKFRTPNDVESDTPYRVDHGDAGLSTCGGHSYSTDERACLLFNMHENAAASATIRPLHADSAGLS